MSGVSPASQPSKWLTHSAHGETAQKDENGGERLDLDSCSVTFTAPLKCVSHEYTYVVWK